ncbi:DNA-dependent RNA polymerase [Aphelenchoides avenae]|nr:DNA-dependent RNA polymerase [Aphelenchus avenae]
MLRKLYPASRRLLLVRRATDSAAKAQSELLRKTTSKVKSAAEVAALATGGSAIESSKPTTAQTAAERKKSVKLKESHEETKPKRKRPMRKGDKTTTWNEKAALDLGEDLKLRKELFHIQQTHRDIRFMIMNFIRGDDLQRLLRYVRDVTQQTERYGYKDQLTAVALKYASDSVAKKLENPSTMEGEEELHEILEDYVRFLEQFPLELPNRPVIAADAKAIEWLRRKRAEHPAAFEIHKDEVDCEIEAFERDYARHVADKKAKLTTHPRHRELTALMGQLETILADQSQDRERFGNQLNGFLDLLRESPREFLNFNSIAACALSLQSLAASESGALGPFRNRIESVLENVKAKLADCPYHRLNRLLFTDDEFATIRAFIGTDPLLYEEGRAQTGYDENLQLVAGLDNEPEKYLGSPLAITQRTQEDFMKLLDEQLKFEQQYCIPVKNVARATNLPSMEALIGEWGWLRDIERTYIEKLSILKHPILKTYLVGLEPAKVAKRLHEAILMTPCQAADFATELEVLREVYTEYLRYVFEEDIARHYTQRAWWTECAQKFGVYANFQLLPGDFDKHSFVEDLRKFLLEVVMEACTFYTLSPKTGTPRKREPAFHFQNVVEYEMSMGMEREEPMRRIEKMLAMNSKLSDLIQEHQFEYLMFPCHLLPMKVLPRPWMDLGQSGPLLTRPSAVMRNSKDAEVSCTELLKQRLRDRVQARPVFDALNDLGAMPWIINKPMLKVLMEILTFTNDPKKEELLNKLGVPLRPIFVDIPDYEETFGAGKKVADIPTEDWRAYAKKKFEAIKHESTSLWLWFLYRLLLAEHYKDDVLFFPHNMDFRGRVYPISPLLNHMGDDVNRCLLKFAKGKKLGKDGLRWLKLHCVNITGLMKRESVEKRLQYAEEHLEDMIDSANNPFDGKGWWLDSDDPWQTLSACMELRDVLASGDPENYVSHLPIHQDGSCNGLQHFAALGRDEQGAAEVNVLPSDSPTDVYTSVVQRVEQKRIADESSEDPEIREIATSFRQVFPPAVPRKVVKQTVMTTVYGVTIIGAIQQIKRQLKALGLAQDEASSSLLSISRTKGLRQPRRCVYLFYVSGALNRSSAVMAFRDLKKWFQAVAKTIVGLMRPVEWTTPLGLPVVQPYMAEAKDADTLRMVMKPTLHKQKNAFAPNFVHSLDSTHMMLTTLFCRHRGITFAAVHDCYWTHASTVDDMNVICREQFIALHRQPIVQQLSESFREKYLTPELLKLMPEEERKELEAAFEPEFKPGNLDIERVRDSVYFFS